jgi:hypothetical protein
LNFRAKSFQIATRFARSIDPVWLTDIQKVQKWPRTIESAIGFDRPRNIGMYAMTADTKNEELLADSSETLASAKTIAQDVASLLPPAQRRALLEMAQLIMLGELAVNRALDNLQLPG